MEAQRDRELNERLAHMHCKDEDPDDPSRYDPLEDAIREAAGLGAATQLRLASGPCAARARRPRSWSTG